MTELQTVVDRLEIDDLLTRYSTAIDGHDWDLLDTVFTPDAHLDYRAAAGTAGSYPEVKAWLADVLPSMFEVTQHFVMNRAVEIDGDRATARSMFLNPNRQKDGDGYRHFTCGGYYLDELERRPEGWRITRRVEDMTWWRDQMPGLPDVPPGLPA